MSATQFRRAFLRLAARTKGLGERKSPLYERRLTGEKGVGRLAAHKLGALLEIRTVAALWKGEPAVARIRNDYPKIEPAEIAERVASLLTTLVEGRIDWDEIEQAESAEAGPGTTPNHGVSPIRRL